MQEVEEATASGSQSMGDDKYTSKYFYYQLRVAISCGIHWFFAAPLQIDFYLDLLDSLDLRTQIPDSDFNLGTR